MALESIAGLLAEVDDVTSVLGGLGKEQQEAQASGVVLVEVGDDDEIAGIGVHGAAGQQGRGRKMLAKVLAAAKARDEGACASGQGPRKGNEQGPASPRKSCSAQRGRPASSRRRGAPAAAKDAEAGVTTWACVLAQLRVLEKGSRVATLRSQASRSRARASWQSGDRRATACARDTSWPTESEPCRCSPLSIVLNVLSPCVCECVSLSGCIALSCPLTLSSRPGTPPHPPTPASVEKSKLTPSSA